MNRNRTTRKSDGWWILPIAAALCASPSRAGAEPVADEPAASPSETPPIDGPDDGPATPPAGEPDTSTEPEPESEPELQPEPEPESEPDTETPSAAPSADPPKTEASSPVDPTPAEAPAENSASAEPPTEPVEVFDHDHEQMPTDRVEPEDVREIVVHGEENPHETNRGASHYRIDRETLEAAPHAEAAEMLHTAPGVFVGRAGGGAIAHRYILRGFDADHGQDIAMRVGGLPINLPSHIHGQGYADLGFLIGEVVDDLHVTEGVYDPRQGDFAVAGSFDIHLGVHRRGWRVASSYGRFNTFRQLGIWAPKKEHEQTFSAVQYSRSDGFGDNRRGQAVSGMFQARFGREDRPWDHRAVGFIYGSRYDIAGVLRFDDIESGAVDFHGVYPLATARGQDAMSTRVMVGEFSHYHGAYGEAAELGVWFGYDTFRSEQNFTGFTEVSQSLAEVSGRGDLNQQLNRTFSAGVAGSYSSQNYSLANWAGLSTEFGFDGRVDRIDQSQSLVDASVRNQIWDERVDAQIGGVDLGLYADTDWWLTQYLRLRGGIRADALFYDVNDRLGNFVPNARPDDEVIVGFRRSAAGVAVGPRTSATIIPLQWLAIRGAYGQGYRSPQARVLEDGERAPFTKVHSADLGLRLHTEDGAELSVSGFWTKLSDDVVFDPDEARLERVGATRRTGAVVAARARPVDWVVAAVSVTYVDAELLEPPPATAEEPQPPFSEGQNLPFVPPVMLRADLGIHGPLARKGQLWELGGRLGTGFSYLSPRPLPYGLRSQHVPLLDASAGLTFGPLDLTAAFFNVLAREYATVEYAYASQWDPTSSRSRAPARHLAAGAPFSFMFTLGVSL